MQSAASELGEADGVRPSLRAQLGAARAGPARARNLGLHQQMKH